MWMKVNHPIFGDNVWAWVMVDMDIVDVVWKSGTITPGQVWAQFDPDGPFRPANPA